MKKQFLFLSLLAISTTSFLFTGCSKDDDTTPPVVTLLGDSNPTLNLQTTYVDPGASATDNEDGTVAVTVTGSVDKNLVGSYTLTYSATDAAGNTGTAVRTVNYVNQTSSDPFTGNWSCIITTSGQAPYAYNESLSISTTLNNGLEWSKFGDYSNANAKLNIEFGGSNQVTIASQTIICGTIPVARTFSGSGTKSGTGSSGSTIILNINETVNSATTAYTYTYTKQ